MKKLGYKDILHTKQFSREDLELIFETAGDMEKYLTWEKKWKPLDWCIVWSMFYEPSTRTRLSFEAATKRLWWDILSVSGMSGTSFKKWESLEDNAKMLENYSDIIVMRHPTPYSVNKTAESVSIPVVNAWDWSHQHPTQWLLDVYTILKEKWRLNDLKIAICWDLKYSRTIHSLVFLMWLFDNISFVFIAPEELQMPKKITSFLDEESISYVETQDYAEWIKGVDILYTNRIQEERFSDNSEYLELKDSYILTHEILKSNPDVVIMNPLPRVNEIDVEVDSLDNAAYFRQAANWVPVRMALLYLLLI